MFSPRTHCFSTMTAQFWVGVLCFQLHLPQTSVVLRLDSSMLLAMFFDFVCSKRNVRTAWDVAPMNDLVGVEGIQMSYQGVPGCKYFVSFRAEHAAVRIGGAGFCLQQLGCCAASRVAGDLLDWRVA